MDPALILIVGVYRYEGEFVTNRRARFWTGSRMSNWVWVLLHQAGEAYATVGG